MTKYVVTKTEHLSHSVIVEANSPDEADELAEVMFNDPDYFPDYHTFTADYDTRELNEQ